MTHLSFLLTAAVGLLVPLLPLSRGDTAGVAKDRQDALVAAMKFVKVPKGTFWMGWDSDKQRSKQQEIKQDFELAAYPVTQGQWKAVMGRNPSYFARTGDGKEQVKDIADDDLKHFPVETVSWEDAQEFLKKLNAREKGRGWWYRLPTEAEWEYACRGAATSREDCSFDFYLARPTNDLSSKQANFDGDYPAGNAEAGPNLLRTTRVGSYAPNQLGLYDMHGNVLQWCADCYDGVPSGCFAAAAGSASAGNAGPRTAAGTRRRSAIPTWGFVWPEPHLAPSRKKAGN